MKFYAEIEVALPEPQTEPTTHEERRPYLLAERVMRDRLAAVLVRTHGVGSVKVESERDRGFNDWLHDEVGMPRS